MWCKDRKGYGWHVHGSDADYLLTDERNCLLLPDDLTFIDGAFIACIAGTAYSSMRKLKVSGEDTVAVFGLGPVGLCGVVMAKAMGGRVIGIDVIQERLRLAQEMGADEVIDAAAHDPVKTIDALTGGEGADAAFETSGKPKAQAEVISALSYGGRGVFVGIGSQEKSVNPSDMVGKQLTLMGSFVSPINYYWDLVDFIRGRKLNFERMVTHRFPIAEAQEAFRAFDGGKTGKVVFEWD
jgi:propanol-preferring alcohol dehydrogenase